MKIGIDIRNVGKKRTGDEVVFLNLVRSLSKIDTENEYFLFTDILEQDKLEEVRKVLQIQDKNNFYLVPIKSKNKFTWNLYEIISYLKKNPVDIYHTQYIVPFFFPKKIKLVTTIHDVSFNAFAQFIALRDLLFLKMLIPYSVRRVDKVIAVSQYTKDEIVKYYKISPEKIVVVYNALSYDFKRSLGDKQSNQANQIREKYDLPEKYILYVGTLQPRKNIPFLLEAFSEIAEKMPEVKLLIVGNRKAHNFDKRIDEVIRAKGLIDKVVFPGYIDQQDIVWIYRLAEIFAFPSLYEGFGIPMLESMSQQVPVIAIDNKISREVCADAAVYTDQNSVANFSNNLYNLVIDKKLREKLINLGNQRVDFFSWDISAQVLLKQYQELVKK